MNKVIVVGSLNVDMTFHASLPSVGETIKGAKYSLDYGGKGANQATSAAKMYAKTYMIGCVGQDFFGNNIVSFLNENGIHTEFISFSNQSTGVACILVDNMDNRILVDSGANNDLSIGDVNKALDVIAQKNDILLTQLEIPYDVVFHSLKRGKSLGLTTILNPAPAVTLDDEIYKFVDIIIPNESEAELLTGFDRSQHNFCELVVDFFIKKGVKSVIITLGNKGAYYGSKLCSFASPNYDVDVVDTTAAGDTFVGVIGSGLANQEDLKFLIKKANAASALTISKTGAQSTIPNYDSVMNFMKERDII